MPEIDAVADGPQPDQRPPRKVSSKDRSGDDEDRHQYRGSPERGDEKASLVQEALGATQVCPQDRIEGESRHSEQEKNKALAHAEARQHPPLSAPSERGGEGGAEQDRLRSRVGPIVETGFAGAVSEEHRRLGCRGQHAQQREPEHGADSSEYRQHPHDEDGPEEIELLLDRQGPGVREGRRGPGRGEVVRSLCDEVPIGDVERRTEDVPAQGRIGPRWERQLRDEHHRHNQEEQTRQKPTRPPGPEVSEPDAPVALHFGQQQGGDQESGENEEGVDSEVATGQRADASVVREDARDSKGPHPIECGNVAEARVLSLSAFRMRTPTILLRG